MSEYMRKPEMMAGGPFKCFNGGPFYCYNCGKKLAEKILNFSSLIIKCYRCHSSFLIKAGRIEDGNGKGICSNNLSVKVKSPLWIQLLCNKCKSFISIKMGEPAAFAEKYFEIKKKEEEEKREADNETNIRTSSSV